MQKIALVGATGYLGQHIGVELNKIGIYPSVLVRRWDSKLSQKIKTSSVLKVDFTSPISLRKKLFDVDTVISTLGITRQKDGLTYMDVDFQCNMNLLEEAKKAKVKKFVYFSALHGDKLKDIDIFKAKEKFVDELKKSGLEYVVIRPNGFFSDMKDFLNMAKTKKIYLFGDGSKSLNPIHGEDLAKFCISSLVCSNLELEIGGPKLYTQKEIANLAFESLDIDGKIIFIPDCIRKLLLKLLPIFLSKQKYGPIEFFLSVMGRDMIAKQYGEHTLENFFKNNK